MLVAVIFGSKSTEYEVSCVSASSVIKNLRGCDIVKIGITKDGKWFKTEPDADKIASLDWVRDGSNIPISVSFEKNCFVADGTEIRPDVIFPVLHGANGEDGTVQGLFELLDIPYVGCRVLGSALCMDKAYTKIVLKDAGFAQTPWVTFNRYQLSDMISCLKEVEDSLEYPVFVKPSNAGSSVGIKKCSNSEELEKALIYANEFDRRIVVEQGVKGVREIEVAVLGNDSPLVSLPGEIVAGSDFYDYEAKYVSNTSVSHIPAAISPSLSENIRFLAAKAFLACDCKGLSRVDFFLDENENVFINEINTLPGFTPISMYSKLFEYSGIAYSELLDRLISLAIDFKNR